MTEKEKKADFYFDKATRAYEKGDYKTAKNNWEKVIKLNPNHADAYYNLAIILTKYYKKYEKAKQYNEKAIELSSDFAEAYYNLALIFVKYYKENEKAKQYYEKAIDINPSFSDAYFNLANLLKNQFQEYKKAKEYYEKTIKLSPNYAGAYNNLAGLLKDNFYEYETAKKNYEKAIKLNPNYDKAYYNLANILTIHFKENETAKKNYEKAIEINPNYANAYYNLAFLLKNHFQEYKKAKQYFEKAIKLDSNLFQAHHNLALLLHDEFDDIENAQFHFLKAIEIGKEDISRLELDKRINFTDETFISDLEIKKVRHINNVSIKLSDTEKKHLIFTGKNGSGKTSVLIEAKKYLEEILELPIDKEFIIKAKEQSLSKDNYNLKFNIKGSLLTLRLKYETGNFIAAYFPARRELNLKPIEGRPDNIEIPLTAKISERLNDNLIDYYWNIKTQALLALEKEDFVKKKKLDNLINAFIDKFKIIDSRIKKVEFTAEKGKYNIEFIPEEPYEKFDFSTLADGYASIFDFISEIILRMSNRTYDVFNLEGVVLIDEPETHLHIEMQQKVLPLLSTFFPNVQFIVATHSPFILNSIDNTIVYDLETSIKTEKLSKIPVEKINEYLKLDKKDVEEIEKEIYEFIDLVELLKTNNITEKQGQRIAELDLKLNKLVPSISDNIFKDFKKSQKELY